MQSTIDISARLLGESPSGAAVALDLAHSESAQRQMPAKCRCCIEAPAFVRAHGLVCSIAQMRPRS